jgi:hypothetical protein
MRLGMNMGRSWFGFYGFEVSKCNLFSELGSSFKPGQERSTSRHQTHSEPVIHSIGNNH